MRSSLYTRTSQVTMESVTGGHGKSPRLRPAASHCFIACPGQQLKYKDQFFALDNF